MLSSSSISLQHFSVCVVVSWYVVDNLYLWYCVKSLIVCHEFNDALAEVTDLDADIPQEGAA